MMSLEAKGDDVDVFHLLTLFLKVVATDPVDAQEALRLREDLYEMCKEARGGRNLGKSHQIGILD